MKKELLKIRASVLRHDLPLARSHNLLFVFIGAKGHLQNIAVYLCLEGDCSSPPFRHPAWQADTSSNIRSALPKRDSQKKKSSSSCTTFLTLPTQCCPVGQEIQYPVTDHGLCVEVARPQDRGISSLDFLE